MNNFGSRVFKMGIHRKGGVLPRRNFASKLACVFISSIGLSTIGMTQSKLIDTGVTANMRYLIDTNSVRQEGGITRYRLEGQWLGRDSNGTFSAEVGVDCATRSRIEYWSATQIGSYSSSTTASTPELRSVYEGTRQADEVTIACRLASELGIDSRRKTPPQVTEPPVPLPPAATPPSIPAPPTTSTKPKSSGTGFAVSADGIFVTNNHVVEDCGRVRVLIQDTLYDAKLLAQDESNDLAALRVSGARIPPLQLAPKPIELGATITILGFPLTTVLGTDLKATTGIVSSLSGVKGERRHMQISAGVQPGNSGGPVLDDRGSIVGVVVAKLASRFAAENVNFAVRAPVLRSFLELNGFEMQLSKQATQLSVAEIAKRSAPSTALIFCY